MFSGRFGNLCNIVVVLVAAGGLAACNTAEALLKQSPNSAEAPVQTVAAPAAEPPAPPQPPMTREQASTDCWMKYEKDGRGLSLDQRLPTVEKCTAEKLKAAGR